MRIEFDEVKLEIPEGWKDIRLSEYEQWYMSQPESRYEMITYVANVCKIDAKLLLDAPTQIFNTIYEAIQFVFNHDFEPKNKCTINGTDYFISFADKLTLGEYVDVESIMEGDSKNKLSELLSIICRPIGEKYNPDLTEDRINLFKNIGCDEALPLISFFLSKKKKSEEISNLYSKVTEGIDRYQKDIQTSVINMGGIKQFRIWQAIKYYFSMRSQRKKLLKFSDSFYTESINPELKKSNINLKNR